VKSLVIIGVTAVGTALAAVDGNVVIAVVVPAIGLVGIWLNQRFEFKKLQLAADKVQAELKLATLKMEQDNLAAATKLAKGVKCVDEKVEGVVKVTTATHTLANHDRGVLLREVADAKRRVSDLTPDDMETSAAAIEAERAALSHAAAQLIVDVQPGTDAEKKGKADVPPGTDAEKKGKA